MNTPIFTQYIEGLQAKDCPQGLLDAVAKTLRFEMEQRGLWTLPPAWLGYKDWNSWNEKLAFKELLFDCYIEAITARLLGLQAALKQSQDIDGLVRRNIKNFITDLQKKHDSLGYNVAQHHAKKAVECAVDKGILEAGKLNHKGKVQNPTLLTFSTAKSTTPSEKEPICEALRNNPTWVEIRPELAGKSKKFQERLYEIVCQLKDADINCFRFKSLADAMKEEVRAIHPKPQYISIEATREKMEKDENANDEIEAQIPDIFSEIFEALDSSPEENDHNFFKEIRDAIDNSPHQKRVRQRLHQILTEFEEAFETEKEFPSQTELSKRLNVSIGTINEDINTRFRQLKK